MRTGGTIDENVRKTQVAGVSKDFRAGVESRLQSLLPDLQKHFGAKLSGFERPQFLVYEKGNLYRMHRDSVSSDEDGPDLVKQRKVSAVIFLNGQSDMPKRDTFTGGGLVFYRLIHDPRWERYGFDLQPERGLLIAFSSDIVHEVEPVTRGKRYSIVTWFF